MWVTIPLMVLLGYASVTFMATANTLLQLVSPPELRGRVMSLWAMLFAGTTPIGSMIIGALSERYSVRSAVEGMALLCGLGVVMAFVYLRHVRGARGLEVGA